ncbi:hypothetical protein ACE1SV_09110 [Streptomyces sennicomposti]
MIEFTFQVAMRMPTNLPGGTDNAAGAPSGPVGQPRGGAPAGTPPRPVRRRGRCVGAPGRSAAGRARRPHSSAEPPGASRRCSAPPRPPI